MTKKGNRFMLLQICHDMILPTCVLCKIDFKLLETVGESFPTKKAELPRNLLFMKYVSLFNALSSYFARW